MGAVQTRNNLLNISLGNRSTKTYNCESGVTQYHPSFNLMGKKEEEERTEQILVITKKPSLYNYQEPSGWPLHFLLHVCLSSKIASGSSCSSLQQKAAVTKHQYWHSGDLLNLLKLCCLYHAMVSYGSLTCCQAI